MTLPINFLYLGGDKCGSTWIHRILSQHPDVALARAKELFYFDQFYEKGAGWYLRQFPTNTNARRMGEICHDYLYSEEALQRIQVDLPQDSRFIVTTRAPIDRAFSHYRYLKRIGRTRLSFPEALKEHPRLIDHSMFGKYVSRAQDRLGSDRVHVLSFDLLQADASAFGVALSDALGIPFLPNLPYAEKVLEAQTARHPQLVAALRNAGWAMRRVGVPHVVNRVKSNPVVQHVLFSQARVKPTDALTDDLKNHLNETFAKDQELLRRCVPSLEIAA